MPRLALPFELKPLKQPVERLLKGELVRGLPEPMRRLCEQRPHFLQYLAMLPLEEIGLPEYHEKLDRSLGERKERNIVYPAGDEIVIHVFSKLGEERDFYIAIEPAFATLLGGTAGKGIYERQAVVEERLLDYSDSIAGAKTDEAKKKAITQAMQKICKITPKPRPYRPKNGGLFSNGLPKIEMTRIDFEAVRYLTIREKVGMGILEPLIVDPYIEDVSGAGLGPIFVEHKVFKGMRTALELETHPELDDFVLRLSEAIKRPVTMRNPIADAVLPDGSRINIVYGKELSARGSNFTIRKFSDTPLSVLELIEFGSLDYRIAAYLSMVLGEGMNTFVAGETASGKTTLINAITTFVPPHAKVVSIEDTPEVQVPHANWVREVARAPGKDAGSGPAVSMFDLLKAALRQRPNLIIIGEIRGEEGLIAFQAMQTGHAVMATFHAASVEKLIQRLTGSPINVPKTYIDNLNVVVIQSAVKLPNGKMARRAIAISEIVGYDTVTNSFSFVEVFRWNPARDAFEFVGDKNSYLLEEKIAVRRGLPVSRKWEIYRELDRRAKVMEKLHKERGIRGYYEFLKVLTKARQEGLF